MVGGKGPRYREHRERAEELGLANVAFVGDVPYSELLARMADASVCLGVFGSARPAKGEPGPGAGVLLGVDARAYTRGILPWAVSKGDLLAQRNPLLLFVSSGVFLLRLAARTLFPLLFHAPPRTTPPGVPT